MNSVFSVTFVLYPNSSFNQQNTDVCQCVGEHFVLLALSLCGYYWEVVIVTL